MTKQSKAAQAATDEKQFYSEDGTDIRVTHPDGSIAIVGEKPRTLPRKLWKEAHRQGCSVVGGAKLSDLRGPDPGPEFDQNGRRASIKQAIEEGMDAGEGAPGYEDFLTAADIPNTKWLSAKVGFNVSASERDSVYKEVLDQIEAGEPDDEDEETEEEGEQE